MSARSDWRVNAPHLSDTPFRAGPRTDTPAPAPTHHRPQALPQPSTEQPSAPQAPTSTPTPTAPQAPTPHPTTR
ncbi:hypothetical protein ACFSJI_34155, partial [Streptomyces calvus]